MKIHALFGLTRMPDGKVIALLKGSLNGLSDHADIFVKAPIDLKTYRNGIVAYEAAIPAALDGSRTAIALKNKLREDASKMYAELAHYAQANCNEDMVTFLLSGFLAAPNDESGSPAPGSTHYRLFGSRPCYRSIEAQDRLGCESVEL